MDEHEHIPSWAQDIRERVVRIETKLDHYGGIYDAAYAAKTIGESNKTAIKKMEDDITWLWRTVLGAVLVSLVGIYVKMRG